MILYNSNYFGLLQLTIFSGSAVYRTVLPSLVSTAMFVFYKYSFGGGSTAQEIKPEDGKGAVFTVHPFVITIYVMAYSLIINHRLNYCYQRYWESCTSLFTMTSKWIDSATTLASFHYQSVVYEDDRPLSFGDADKPPDQLREGDKKKAAAIGGHKRTQTYLYSDGNDGSIASEGSSSSHEQHTLTGSSVTARVGGSGKTAASRQSFVTRDSRHRHRTFSDVENLKRARERFSKTPALPLDFDFDYNDDDFDYNDDDVDYNDDDDNKEHEKVTMAQTRKLRTLFEKMFRWKKKSKRESSQAAGVPAAAAAAVESLSSSLRQHAIPPSNAERGNLHGDRVGVASSKNDHGTSMPSQPKNANVNQSRQISQYFYVKSLQNPSEKSLPRQGHRRVPSTDIPIPGHDGNVKSFKPNLNLPYKKRTSSTMPLNTGLHTTIIVPNAQGLDLEELLLEEEKKRKRELRRLESEASKQRPGWKAGKRRSLPHITKSLRWKYGGKPHSIDSSESEYSDSGSDSGMLGRSVRRGASEPTRRSDFVDGGTANKDSIPTVIREEQQNLNSLLPKLELCDLPSLDGLQSNWPPRDGKTSPDTAELDYDDDSGSHRLAPDTIHVSTGNRSGERQSASYLQPPVEKLNGRTSLFLQEAAHLYSLMSAVSMASLRADMEGVSSPLIDYVPGQRFPPVNPDEMRVKILFEEDKVTAESQNDPDLADCACPTNTETEKSCRNQKLGSKSIRIERNSALENLWMFLSGSSRTSRQRTIYNASRPFTVLGGISDNEVEMLRNVRGHSAQHALCSLWLREFITREHLNGSTGKVHPPIMARVYQYISDGTTQYNNCRKTAFTDFPFPHAQLTSFFGFVSIFLFPLLYYTYVDSTMVGIVFNMFTVMCFFGIQEAALELEEPFIRYPNDLPLNNYQAQFNEALISSLYSGFHPDAWGGVVDNEGIFSTKAPSLGESQGSLPSVIGENISVSSAGSQRDTHTIENGGMDMNGEASKKAIFSVPEGSIAEE